MKFTISTFYLHTSSAYCDKLSNCIQIPHDPVCSLTPVFCNIAEVWAFKALVLFVVPESPVLPRSVHVALVCQVPALQMAGPRMDLVCQAPALQRVGPRSVQKMLVPRACLVLALVQTLLVMVVLLLVVLEFLFLQGFLVLADLFPLECHVVLFLVFNKQKKTKPSIYIIANQSKPSE